MKLRNIAALTTFLISGVVVAQDEFPGIENLMTDKEFESAGLAQLSEDQLRQLNVWLLRYTANDAEIISKNNDAVRKEADKEYKSRIVGEFTGWDGDTVFYLENGEVWRQRHSGRWRTRLQNPEVLIYKNMLGLYNLKVLEAGRLIGVTRVK